MVSMTSDSQFDLLAARFAAQRANENTRAAYAADLRRFADWCHASGVEPLEADAGDLDRYRDDVEGEGRSAATVARRLAAITSFFAYAVREGEIDSSPTSERQRPRATTTPGQSLNEAQSLVLLAAAARRGPKVDLLVSLLLRDGVKLAEALAADASDLDRRRTTLHVRRHGDEATVSLSDLTARAAARYLHDRRSGPLLLSDRQSGDDARLTRFGADFLLKQAAHDAGIEQPISANTLRRSYAENAYKNGMSLGSLRDHLGHRDERTTARLSLMPPDPSQ